jgi:hypothetical protein
MIATDTRRHRPRWFGVSAVFALLLALASACGGHITIAGVTFGDQRTPPTVVTVTNAQPTLYSQKSQNWSGYFMQTGAITAISATWQVPQVTGTSDSDSSTWIGIGGVKNGSLIQAGTDQLIQHGKTYYAAWIEALPALPQPVKEIVLLPGDTVTVSITYQGSDTWHVAFADKDANTSTTKSMQYASCFCSADWIEEAPSLNNHQSALAHFTSATFTNLSVTVQGSPIVPDQMCPHALPQRPFCLIPLRMVDTNGKTIVQPQILQNGGFSVVDVRGTVKG